VRWAYVPPATLRLVDVPLARHRCTGPAKKVSGNAQSDQMPRARPTCAGPVCRDRPLHLRPLRVGQVAGDERHVKGPKTRGQAHYATPGVRLGGVPGASSWYGCSSSCGYGCSSSCGYGCSSRWLNSLARLASATQTTLSAAP
jgi:hypothetical protein